MTSTEAYNVASDNGAPPVAHPSAVFVASTADGFKRPSVAAARASLARSHVDVTVCLASDDAAPRNGTIAALLADPGFFVDAVVACDASALVACRADVVRLDPAAVFILVADDPANINAGAQLAVRQVDLVVVSDATRPIVSAMALHAPLVDLPATGPGVADTQPESWLGVVNRAMEIRTRVVGDVASHLRTLNEEEDLA